METQVTTSPNNHKEKNKQNKAKIFDSKENLVLIRTNITNNSVIKTGIRCE